VSGELHTVHLRINDAATGRPTPVRLRVTGPDGKYYAPFGRLTQFATGWGQDVGGNLMLDSKTYAYIDGACEIALPAGRLFIEATKGPEYTPLHQEVELAPGKLALRFTIERWADLRKEGWYSGDCRTHFLTPHAALLEGAAEDLAVVNLLIEECRLPTFNEDTHAPTGPLTAIPNILAFSGQRPAVEIPAHMVVVNTHNRHPFLGSLALLNCHRVVHPLWFGGPDGWDDWTLADWCDQCHRKGGLVIWTDFDDWYCADDERLADLILGRIDALETSEKINHDPEWKGYFGGREGLWEACLDFGLRIHLVGSSGKCSNKQAVGSVRTYARLDPGQELNCANWMNAVRAGRTFVTRGPLITFSVNEQSPGSVLDVPDESILRISAVARSLLPFERLEVICGGEVVNSVAASDFTDGAQLEFEMVSKTATWLAARCTFPDEVRAEELKWFAHTSPVYVHRAGKPFPPSSQFVTWFSRYSAAMRRWIRDEGRFAAQEQRDRLLAVFDAADAALAARASAG
jgi:hypothetical protein